MFPNEWHHRWQYDIDSSMAWRRIAEFFWTEIARYPVRPWERLWIVYHHRDPIIAIRMLADSTEQILVVAWVRFQWSWQTWLGVIIPLRVAYLVFDAFVRVA